MVVNNTWELLPWADVLHAGDLQWWDRYGAAASVFSGEKWTREELAAARYRLRQVTPRNGRGLCTEPGAVHTGGNSGYQAINLAYHFGARRIVLIGFDMHRQSGGHWHGEHVGMLSAPDSHIRVWIRHFRHLARDLRRAGVVVTNCTPGSALTHFPCAPLMEALRCS